MINIFIYFLSLIGLYVLLFYLYDHLITPIKLFISGVKQLMGLESKATFISKYGEWVAITGATDGIGRAFARELARKGFHIVLISRNLDKLQKTADEIEREFKVKTNIIVADFSKGKEICKQVGEQLNNLSVQILVNNVGTSTSEPGPLASFSDDELWDVINTNIGPVTILSRYFIKRLRDASQTGLIVNVSSITEHFPVSKGAVYGATKAYIRSLTLALQEEARPYGIDVQLLSPHFVVTKINSYSKFIMSGNLFIPDVETFAKSAVNRLGKLDQTTGYCWHDVALAVLNSWPNRLKYYITSLSGRIILSRSKIREI